MEDKQIALEILKLKIENPSLETKQLVMDYYEIKTLLHTERTVLDKDPSCDVDGED